MAGLSDRSRSGRPRLGPPPARRAHPTPGDQGGSRGVSGARADAPGHLRAALGLGPLGRGSPTSTGFPSELVPLGCPSTSSPGGARPGWSGTPGCGSPPPTPTRVGSSSGPSNWPEGVGCHPSHQRRLPWAPSAGGGRLPLGPGRRHPPRPPSTAAARSPAGSGSTPRSGSSSAPAPVLTTTRWSGSGGAEDVFGRHPGGDHGGAGASGAGLRSGAQPGATVAMCLVVPLALVARGFRRTSERSLKCHW
jgi:hypothetical protein